MLVGFRRMGGATAAGQVGFAGLPSVCTMCSAVGPTRRMVSRWPVARPRVRTRCATRLPTDDGAPHREEPRPRVRNRIVQACRGLVAVPTFEALGEGWVRGEIDVAGEHSASHAAGVHVRRGGKEHLLCRWLRPLGCHHVSWQGRPALPAGRPHWRPVGRPAQLLRVSIPSRRVCASRIVQRSTRRRGSGSPRRYGLVRRRQRLPHEPREATGTPVKFSPWSPPLTVPAPSPPREGS